MRKMVLMACLVAGVPAGASAAPCVAGSLADYIALGAGGCTFAGATLADFSSGAAPGAIAIDPDAIFVTPAAIVPGGGGPASLGVTFQLTGAAAAGEIKGNGIGYSLGGPTFVARHLELANSSVEPDGVVTAVQARIDPLDPGRLLDPLIVFDIGIDAELFASAALPPASFFDIFTEITLDGGLSGFAGQDVRVTELFDPQRIPEPAALGLLGAGLAALAWRRRVTRATR